MRAHKLNPEFSMDIPLTTRIQYRTYMKLIIKNTLKNNIDKCLHVTDEMIEAELDAEHLELRKEILKSITVDNMDEWISSIGASND